MFYDTQYKRVEQRVNREERERKTKGQTRIKWMRAHAMQGCRAGIRFPAYPKGSDRFTNGHREN